MAQTDHAPTKHPFHLVAPSPWPILTAFAAGLLAIGLVFYMHDTKFGTFVVGSKGLVLGIVAVLACMFVWWRDVIREGVVEKAHSPVAKLGFRYGMLLFIASEVMFFVAFFWAFFWAKLYPGIGIEHVFPPKTIAPMDPFELPFLMTLILLLSGCTVTWAHHSFMTGNLKEARQGLWCTVGLGMLFSCIQFYEYHHAAFKISDTILAAYFIWQPAFTACMSLSAPSF